MGDRTRGASMGRDSRIGDTEAPLKMHLRRVYLDSGGYDSGRSYWGHGEPMYEAFSADGDEFITLRAWTRPKAKAQVFDIYPNATFFR